jgi:hypothetical protein
MESRVLKFLGLVFAVAVLSASPIESIQAANINGHGTLCLPFEGRDNAANFIMDAVGLYNRGGGVANGVAFALCPAVRSIDTTPTGIVAFFVDGDNFVGGTTTCTLYSYDYTGTFLGSVQGQSSARSYDMYLTLPPEQASFWAYTSVACEIPAGGRLRGVTSVTTSATAASVNSVSPKK